jgi:hypothetical protein
LGLAVAAPQLLALQERLAAIQYLAPLHQMVVVAAL